MQNFHPDHLADLKKSGLNDGTIEQAKIHTVMPPRQIDKKLAFNMPGLSSMYEIPYPCCEDFSRFRCFYEGDKDGAKYLQRKETGNHLYIPPLAASILSDPTRLLYITEGEKKALKACQEDIPCIGLSGLWNWKIKDGSLIPDFDKITLEGRTIHLVPDNDFRKPNIHGYKKNLEQAVLELSYALIDQGAKVFIVELPDGPAKGIDDYLLAYSADEFLALPPKPVRKLTLEKAIVEATLDTLNDVLKRISKIPSQTKQEALVGELAKRLKVSRTALKKDLKRFGAKIDGDQGNKNGLPMIALFPGLVDLVQDDGTVVFLIKDASGLRVENVVDIDGIHYVPPDKTDLPFLLPRSEQCLSYYKSDDLDLFDDLLAYLRRFSRLPDDQWLVVGLFILSTYIQDHPAIRYSPMILFHAAPERGKSRSGKAVTYVAYRGVHLVDMRETNIFRYSGNLGATIFFDIMDLSKAIERAGSTDIMLLRYEKGATVPRVLNPDRGAFKDTTHYPVFGPTIMASNAPVHKILGSRCITYTMPNAPGVYENPTKEFGQEIKERLVAWRGKMMDAPLKDIFPIDGISGRLWDITKPLFQICLQSCPERYNDLVNAVSDIAGQRVQEKKESFDGLLIQVIFEMTQGDATLFDISTADVTAKFNTLWNGDHKSEKWTGRRLNFLGIKTNTKTGYSRFTLDRKSRDMLLTQYGFLEGERNSRNSRNSKEVDITSTKSSEFPFSEHIETQETKKNSKADTHVNSTAFEKPEFSEFISEGVSRNMEKKNLKEVRI